ncbi:MAG: hypothetical protein JO171_05795 [Paludibacterium sp.]|uniref:hypothetical protein n=1 Tax=Paludibacterium sp. TaxID=1917523 RepID=UPI0025E4712F|nr:hypothetical protein [Paludibacterium sp.]MBV8046642.1 hypothetical protein [Paludibacterium sp.]MBV8648639.1 hypothetical protein [Paludibacterium sp.]
MKIVSMRISSLALVFVIALSACGFSTTPRADARFGQSLRALQTQQTIHPQGAPNQAQLPALAGDVAVEAQRQYRASFAEREQKPAATVVVREQMQ